MATKFRGSTQLHDASVPLAKLSAELQERIQREQKRADFTATAGQTVLTHADFSGTLPTHVYLNGVLLQSDECTVGAGEITLAAPAVEGDQITVLYGFLSTGLVVEVLAINHTGTWFRPLIYQTLTGQRAVVGTTEVAATGVAVNAIVYSEQNITSGGLTALAFDNLGLVGGNFSPTGMPTLTSLSLPALAAVGGNFSPYTMAALTSLSMPALAAVGGNFSPGTMAALTSLSLPALAAVGGSFNPYAMAALTSLSLPALAAVGGNFNPSNMAALTSLSLPAIEVLGAVVNLTAGTGALTTLDLGATLKAVGSNVTISSAALDQASVDNLLVRLAALDGTNGTMVFGSGRTVTITGTSATPSQTGLDAKAILVARGVTVTHN